MSCESFDCYSIWFGGFLMVQKVGEINLFFTTFVNKTTMDSFGLFHHRFTGIMTNNFDLGAQNAKIEYLTLGVWAFSPKC